jgi:hypothetical protein
MSMFFLIKKRKKLYVSIKIEPIIYIYMCVCVCVCVCVRERERASERAKERNCKTYQNKGCTKTINASSFFFLGQSTHPLFF